jgi:hypothetical protein
MRRVLNLGKRLDDTLIQIAAMRFLSVESFLTQLADAYAADFRLSQYRAKREPPFFQPPQAAADPDADLPTGHQLSPEAIQKLLWSYPALTVVQISKRFGIAQTTVRRILKVYAKASHNHPPPLWAAGMQSRGHSEESEQP